jgi:hypothetical protein
MDSDPDLTYTRYRIRGISQAQLPGAAELAEDYSLQPALPPGRRAISVRPSDGTLPYATGSPQRKSSRKVRRAPGAGCTLRAMSCPTYIPGIEMRPALLFGAR